MKLTISMLLLLTFFTHNSIAILQGSVFTDSLQDCQDLLKLFQYTWNPLGDSNVDKFPYNPTDLDIYEFVTCDFPGVCPDGVNRNSCSWQRFFIMECLQTLDNQVKILMGTNSLPNHCYYTNTLQPLGSDSTYEFYGIQAIFNLPIKEMSLYNPASSLPFYQANLVTQTDIDIQLCTSEWANPDLMDKNFKYEQGFAQGIGAEGFYLSKWETPQNDFPLLKMPSSDEIVGVALNGVFLFSGTSSYGYDAFFPKAFGEKQDPRAIEVDVCLGTSSTYNTYRYHMYSPCIYDINLREVAAPCNSSDYPSCQSDVRDHALQYTPTNMKTLTPIGIAKDGRIIYGPYKTDGTIWQPCDVDVCNGIKLNNRYYAYVATMFHPYIVGCWGPGSKPVSLQQQCSTNGRLCSIASTVMLSMLLIIGQLLSIQF